MQTTIKSLCVGFILVSTTLLPTVSLAQMETSGEQLEKTLSFWPTTMEQVRIQVGATTKEFGVFNRFSSHRIDSARFVFMDKVNDNIISSNNVKEYMESKKPFFISLFEKFKKVEKEFPTSVAEYLSEKPTRVNGDSCFASCYNTNFADGTLDGWYGYYGVNNSPNNNVGPFNITGVTGGYCGPVVKAGGPDPATGHDYQIRVTSGATNDPFLLTYGKISPEVSPWASGGHSVMLGDSTRVDYGVAILSQTFLVTPSTSNFNYQYTVLLENPASHDYYAQPFFSIIVLDQNGDTIPTCGDYQVNGDSAAIPRWGFIAVGPAFWKPWSLVNIPLKHYMGQCVTIIFQVQDCSQGGHWGYAYVNADCSPAQVISSSPNFCGQDSILLTGPPGGQSYTWTQVVGTNGIRGNNQQQNLYIDSAGVYRLIVVPVTGNLCADTLYDTIGKIHGVHPHPAFRADTVCVGTNMTFNNTSLPNDSGIFSWDFYNLGIYNYTNIGFKDTTWSYVNAGIYTVKLHELLDGCGFDTLIKVDVDTAVGPPTFTALPLCTGDSTHFTPTASHATKYFWNFGDPASGIHDSSHLKTPAHLFTSAGTYEVIIKAINAGACDAIDSFPVTIISTPSPVITGRDSTCAGGSVTLTVTGGGNYVWSPGGATTSTVTLSPPSTQTYTVDASNGGCTSSATVTVTVLPAITAIITTSKDSLCKGDTLTLMGRQGLKYKWKPGGQTTSVIHVSQNTTTTYWFYSYAGTCVDSNSITIPTIPDVTATISATLDSVCPGQSTKITVTPAGGAATYSWSPGGATSSSITVMPASTMSYTATVTGECNTFTLIQPITVVPFPQPVIQGTNWKCRGVRDTLVASNLNGPATYVWSNGSTATSIKTGPIDGDSSVTLTAYNKLGCPHDTTFFITLRSPLGVTVPPPAIFCAGSLVCISATISGSPTNPVSYSWTPGGGSTDTICVSPTDTTTYIVTVSNGCKSTRATTLTPNYPNLYSCCSQTISIVDDTVTPGKVILSASGNSKTYQWDPATTVTCLNPRCDSVKLNPTPSVTTTYTITGTDSNGCSISQLITITVDVPCFNLIIPNVFTPTNGGSLGLDKVFYINARNMDAWTITIFDRWGKQVFNSTDTYDYWTGNTPSGGAAPAGVYYYEISATCQGTTYKRDGYLQLIR